MPPAPLASALGLWKVVAALVLAGIVDVTAQVGRKGAVDGVISEYRRAAEPASVRSG
jgi:hypothetical protein